MKRKVAQVGPSTLMVSLPIKWVRERGIKKGDEMEVVEQGNTLLLGTSFHHPSKEMTVVIPSISDYLTRFITAPYVKGYDTIIIKYNDKKVYDNVLDTSKLLMGFEIVENTSHSCTLTNVSTTLQERFPLLLTRLFVTTMNFGRELGERLPKKIDVHGLLEYENTINRLSLFCRRVIYTKAVGENVYSLETLYSLIKLLEESADCYRFIVERVESGPVHLNKNTLELAKKCLRLQEINFTIFNRIVTGEKSNTLLELFKEHKVLRNEVTSNEIYFRGDPANAYICNKLLSLAELSHHFNEELFV